jgi:uncharacterized protein YdcH (DUF465 family)
LEAFMTPTRTTFTREELFDLRKAILDELCTLAPFRRGTVTAHARTCGKPNCKCQKGRNHRHEAYQWTVSVNGKTRYKTVHLGPEIEKYLEETETYRRFQELIESFTLVNEQIADLEPVPTISSEEELAALKKKQRTRFAQRSNGKSTRSSRP